MQPFSYQRVERSVHCDPSIGYGSGNDGTGCRGASPGSEGSAQYPDRRLPFPPRQHARARDSTGTWELIVAVALPATPFAARSHYLKVRDRASYAFAMTSVATAVELQNGVVRSARIALGGVGTKPWRAYEAEKALLNQPLNQETLQAAANAAVQGAKPQKDNGFKIELTERMVMRALATVGGMA